MRGEQEMRKQFLLGLAVLFSGTVVATEIQDTKVIYGDDDRYEVASYPSARIRDLANSVAGMVRGSKLKSSGENFTFRERLAGRALNFCSGERFAEQSTLPTCTGFLVGPDTLVTAGHCITSNFDCSNNKWVFGYVKGTEEIKKKNVFGCKRIIARNQKSTLFTLKDFAVIQLDRKVEGRTPLKFRKKGRVKIGTNLVVIGHPSGLPLKIADGAKVKRMNTKDALTFPAKLLKKRYYFTANLDTYGGNSGSPVFNLKTGVVEGILVQGARDYVRSAGFCNRSNRLSNSRWKSSEKVFRITKARGLDHL